MKLTTLLILAACMQVSARGIAQERVSISGKDMPLEKVFHEIERQTGYAFFYTEEQIQKTTKVTIAVKDATIKEVLDKCLKDQPFSYKIEDKTVFIVKAHPDQKNASIQVQLNLINLKGKIQNDKGEPVVASVTIKGSAKGTTSNQNGEFYLSEVDDNAVLVISGIGIETTEVSISGRNQLNITVKITIKPLDEVQMIAYGTSTKRFNTGNVSAVKSDQIEKQNISNPLLALQGRVPGMFITQNSGVPGSGITVQIRGINSINSGNDPLYVVDGVPYTSQLLPNLGGNILQRSGSLNAGNPFSFINTSDIESISVLKDADATAIYGSRGANGVVLITTKKGTAGKLKVSLNLSTGFGTAPRKIKFMNTQEYLQMRRQAYKNDGITPTVFDAPDFFVWDTTRYTDWQKELIGGTAHYTRAQTSLSGGTPTNQYLISANYSRETSVFPSDFADQKASAHINLNSNSLDQKFKSSLVVNYLVDDNRLPNLDIASAINTPPNTPAPYNEDGTLNWKDWSDVSNPFAFTKRLYKSLTNNLVSNFNLSYELFRNLSLKSSFGYTNMQVDETSIVPIAAQDPAYNPTGNGSFAKNSIQSWIAEPHIIYQATIRKGKLSLLSGFTFQRNKSRSDVLNGSNYTSDLLLESIQAAPRLTISSSMSLYKYNAAFARFNYTENNKYIINLTARRDGSSRFGDNNKFHTFGSVGAAWIFSNEQFIRRVFSFLSFGKLRGSFGTTGNDQIGDYTYYDLYSSNTFQPYQSITGISPTRISNPDLQWEETKKYEGALDLGFLNDKILISGAYYDNRSSNQLFNNAIASTSGFTSYPMNFPATVRNNGWEISVNTTNIKTAHLDWRSSFNIAIPRNKLIAFPNLASSSSSNSLVLGKPIKITKVFAFAGVNDTTGVYQFLNNKGDITYTPAFGIDNTVIVNRAPTYYGGFTNSIGYDGFQVDFTFQFTKQIGTNQLLAAQGGRYGTNIPVDALARWQNPGDETSLQKFTQSYSTAAAKAYQSYSLASEYAYTDASFIRLKNVAISYSPSWNVIKRMKLKFLKIYVIGQNLLTITKYKGMDPENSGTAGISAALPPLRVITFGIEASL